MKLLKQRLFDHYRTSIIGVLCLASGLYVLNNTSLSDTVKTTVGMVLITGAMVLFGIKDPSKIK